MFSHQVSKLILLLLLITFVQADLGYDNPNLPKLDYAPKVITFQNSTGYVNASEIWITAQGNMDNVPDIDYSDFGGSSFWDINVDLGTFNLETTGKGTFHEAIYTPRILNEVGAAGFLLFLAEIRASHDLNALGAGVNLGSLTHPWTDLHLSGDAFIDTLTFSAGSITDSSGAISFGDENLITTGKISAGGTLAAGETQIYGKNVETATPNTGYYGIYGELVNEPTGAYSGWRHGLRGQLTSATAQNQVHGSLRGVLGILYHTGTGTVLATEGVNAAVYHEGGAGTITEGVGGIFQVAHYGVNGGVITAAKGGKFVVGSLGATTGTIGDAIVGSFEANAGGAIDGDNLYLLKLSKTGTWTHTNKYGIYDDTGYDWYTEGNITTIGNITGNSFYGEVAFHNDTSPNVTIINAANVYENVSAFGGQGQAFEHLNGFTHVRESLVAQVAGLFETKYHISASGGANSKYHLVLAINDLEQNNTEQHFRIANVNDVVPISGCGKLQISVGDIITVQVFNEDGVTDLTIFSANMGLTRVGD